MEILRTPEIQWLICGDGFPGARRLRGHRCVEEVLCQRLFGSRPACCLYGRFPTSSSSLLRSTACLHASLPRPAPVCGARDRGAARRTPCQCTRPVTQALPHQDLKRTREAAAVKDLASAKAIGNLGAMSMFEKAGFTATQRDKIRASDPTPATTSSCECGCEPGKWQPNAVPDQPVSTGASSSRHLPDDGWAQVRPPQGVSGLTLKLEFDPLSRPPARAGRCRPDEPPRRMSEFW